jgi:hypothetical protein
MTTGVSSNVLPVLRDRPLPAVEGGLSALENGAVGMMELEDALGGRFSPSTQLGPRMLLGVDSRRKQRLGCSRCTASAARSSPLAPFGLLVAPRPPAVSL